jgi:hypothetical protein
MKICGINVKMSSLTPKLSLYKFGTYMHCAGPGDCFWTSQILFAKRYTNVPKTVTILAQTADLNAPR